MIRKTNTREIFGHCGVPDLIEMFKNITDHIVFTHFGTWFIKAAASGIKKIKSMECGNLRLDIASDGACYHI